VIKPEYYLKIIRMLIKPRQRRLLKNILCTLNFYLIDGRDA